MSDVTGPISSLPGSLHVPPDGAMCDEHPNRVAISRVQGETDSFGSEMHDLCYECVELQQTATINSGHGQCDWCRHDVADLRPQRDYDEGLYGPVYYVCGDCSQSYTKRLLESAK